MLPGRTTPVGEPTRGAHFRSSRLSAGPAHRRKRTILLAGWRWTAARWLATALVAVVGWVLFAPTQLGGRDSYVMTDGTSMLPTIHTGELVVTRAQSSYHVGEIVAYHNRSLHSVLLHRIVGIDGNRFVMKGDNNPSPDLYEPVPADIVGEKWLVWSHGGQLFANLRDPYIGGGILGLLAMFAVAGDFSGSGGKDEPDNDTMGT